MYKGDFYRSEWACTLMVGVAAAFCMSGCSAGPGAGGGGSGTGTATGADGTDDAGRPAPGDASSGDAASDNESEAILGCADPPAYTSGANALPHYDLIPAPDLPRRIRDGERLAEVDLSAFVPTPCNQGRLNACVSWVGSFGLMTYLAAANIDGWTDLDRNDRHFSPTFVFNQVNTFNLGRSDAITCLNAGCYHCDVLTLLRDAGCVTWADMPYNVVECRTQPDDALLTRAADYRIEYFRGVQTDVPTIRAYLEQGIPVMAALRLDTGFNKLGPGDVYRPSDAGDADFTHSILVVGYDDERVAIKVMNSWGTQWGDGGFGFVAADVWEDVNIEAYVVGRDLASPVTEVTGKWSAKTGSAAQPANTPACSVSPLLDSDGDGYPDTMEREFASAGLNPDVPDDNPDYQPLPDADTDGWPDETELVFGTDPDAADDFPFDCDYEFPDGFFDEAPPPTDDEPAGGLRITQVELPDAVTSDAARHALTVYWEGEPVFPVTVVYRPADGGCPPTFLCEELTGEFAEEVNPLVLTDAVWCTGVSDTVEFGYEVVLIDANDTESDPVEAGFTCQAP